MLPDAYDEYVKSAVRRTGPKIWDKVMFLIILVGFITVVLPLTIFGMFAIINYISIHGLPIWNMLPWEAVGVR